MRFHDLKIDIIDCENAEDILRKSIDEIIKHVINTVEIEGSDIINAVMDIAVKAVAVGLRSIEEADCETAVAHMARTFEEYALKGIDEIKSKEANEKFSVWFK